MQLFKKTISLNQAAKISGYAQDYLGYLIRNGELKGIKKGGIWFTTEGEIKSYISKQKSLHKKSNIKNPSSPVLARNISVYILVIIVLVSSFGFYLFGKYNNQVRTFATTSIITTKHFAVDSFNTTKNFAVASLNTTKNLSDKFAHSTLDSWNGSIATSKELGGELLASASSSGISIKEFGISIWNGITSGVNSFLALFSNKDATTPQINIPKSLVTTKTTPSLTPPVSDHLPLAGQENTTPKVASSITNNITQQQRTTYINQYDPAIIPRIQGIEKALTNEIAFNSLQVDRIYYSLGRSITSSSDNITEDGTLNDTTLNDPTLNRAIIKNSTITDSTFAGTTGTYAGNIEALTFNNLTITDNGTNTLNIATGKTLAVTQTLTLSGTDSTVMTFPTTSATIARTDAANTFTGHQTIEGVTSTGATGTGRFVFDNTPTLITPVLGIANGTSLALGGASIGTDALGVTGSVSLSGTTGILGATSINTSGSNVTDIGTGTNAGTITIGNITTGDLALNDANWNITGAGAGTFASGSFTTLTSSGASTIGTGASLTNTFGAGTDAINTFGNATGTNAINGSTTILGTTLINSTGTSATTIGNATGLLTLHGATTLDNTFSQTGANTFSTGTGAISLNGAVSVTGTNTFATGSGTSTFGGDILASTGNINIGSTGTHFGTIYADNVTALNINGTVVTGSTSSNDWTINSDNATLDTENMSIAFERGNLSPNATLVWDATGKKFILNAPLELASTIGTATFLSPGLITATSGITSNGVATFNNNISQVGAYTFGTGTGDVSLNGATTANTFSSSGATITGGTINNSTIGITTPVAGNFTTIGVTSQGTGAFTILNISGQLTSTLATGTSPLAVTSTTLNTNLNADLLDGQHGEYYAAASNISGTLNYVSKFTGTGSTIGDSLIFDNGTNVGIGTTDPTYLLHLESATTPKIAIKNTANDSVGIHIAHDTEGTPQWGTIGFNGANDYFQISNSASFSVAHLVIDSTGNVGIGTTGPGAKLDVSSGFYNPASGPSALSIGADLNATSQTDNTRKIATVITPSYHSGDTQAVNILWVDNNVTTNDLFIGGGNGYRTAPTRIGFWTAPDVTTAGGTERLTILGTGNVGIGTAGPIEKLTIANTAPEALGIYRDLDVTSVGAAGTFINLGAKNGATFTPGATIVGTLDNPASTGYLLFQTRTASSLTTKMAILSNGNVGIGTTNPTYKTEISNIHGGDGLDANGLKITATAGTVGTAKSYGLWVNASGSDDANYAAIFENGNVGIGTTNPGEKLTISAGNILLRNTSAVATSQGIIKFANPNYLTQYGGVEGRTNAAADQIQLAFYTSGNSGVPSEKMTILADGNVGIGTTAPSEILHLSSIGSAKLKISADTDNATETDVAQMLLSQDGGITTSIFGIDDTNSTIIGANSTTASNIYFGTRTDGTSFVTSADAKMTILNGGNVGIGTASPLAPLDIATSNIYGVSSTLGINLSNTSSGGDGTLPTGLGAISWKAGSYTTAKIEGVRTYPNAGAYTDIVFSTGNTSGASEKMRIQENGNIGIGTTAPSGLLDVSGMANGNGSHFTGTSGRNDPILTVESTGVSGGSVGYDVGLLVNVSASNIGTSLFNVKYGGVSKLFVEGQTGNVGIGTTGPNRTLAVMNGGGNSGQLSLGQDPVNYYWSLGRENITNGSFQIIQKDISYTGSSSEIVRLHIDGPTGNIGIGTTSPDVKLTINTADNYLTTGIYAKFQGLSNQRGLEFGQLFNGVNDSFGYIQSRQDSTTVQHLLLNPFGGNVGIGTTNPFYKLDLTVAAVANSTYNFGSNSSVKSNISSTGTYYTNAISTDISNYILGSGVTNSGYAIAANTNAYIDSPNFKGTLAVNTGIQAKAGFYTAGAGAKINNVYAGYFMMLNNSTNGTITNAYGVYIDNSQTTGTITNRYGLYQNGSSAINYFDGSVIIGTLAGSGNRAVYSDASGTLTNTSSDSRLKKNIDTISNKIDVLLSLSKLRGVYYNWDTSVDAVKNLGDQREIGMIAQEVEQVLPELVGTNATGYKSLDYSKMTGFLVEVSKAQQVLINELSLKLGGIEDMSKPNIFRTAITSWFANAGNMIGDFYANRVRTKEICVSNDSGETCITRDKLDNLMASVEGSGGDGGGGEADTTAPVIILTGDALINIAKDEAYTEPGFTADDNIDGDITTAVVVGGDVVDIAVSAIYTITYNVFDAAGNNAAEVTRKVNVGEYVAPEATLESISVATSTAKLLYAVNESLDITGLEVTGTYSDDSTKVETITVSDITGFDSTVVSSSQTLTITIGDKTVDYNIEVE